MFSALRNAFGFLTIFPVGYDDKSPPGHSFAFYPVVGLVIGLLLSAAGLIARQWVSMEIAAFLLLTGWVVLTGGLHLDGFGDACDGLFAAVTPERRLEIMKDSRSGSWAVVGLGLLLLGKWVMLQNLHLSMLILPPVIGRWAMVIAAYGFPYARETGIGAYFRTGFGRVQVMVASLFAVLIVIAASVSVDVRIILILPVTLLILWVAGRWAAFRLGGGLTGDVYGAICELVELMILLFLSSLWPTS